MPSATDLITRSLRLLGVLDATDTPSAEDLAIGKIALDDFVDGLGAERASLYMVTRSVYPLTSGTAAYTIGTGGAFNQVRPVWIEGASVRPSRTASPAIEIPLGRPLTLAEYQAIPVKTTTGPYPTACYYDHNWVAGLGTITVYPVPDNSVCDLVLYTPTAATGFADLSTVYTFPPGWARMYRYCLAIELASDFDAQPSARVQQIAKESLAVVKRANFRPTDASLDPAMPGLRGVGRYNLNTDGYGGTY
ncbi:MAG: hypothetical protein NTY02_05030 [Acidobacteria bacterium]|nr:hypothetical protein [Acidobacteriota bacterium]